MFLGRLALATGWSGNLDYMTEENSLLVRYRLVPVGADEYPYGDGQVWAEPDIDHALELLEGVIADPERARAIAARGRRDIRLGHGYRAVEAEFSAASWTSDVSLLLGRQRHRETNKCLP